MQPSVEVFGETIILAVSLVEVLFHLLRHLPFVCRRVSGRDTSIPMRRQQWCQCQHCPIRLVSYTHLRAHETGRNFVCRLLLEKKIRICKENGIVCKQKDFSLYDVYAADEAFVTGSFGGLTPVNVVDGRKIEGRDLINTLTSLYQKLR